MADAIDEGPGAAVVFCGAFGIIKAVLGFRRFLLRGLAAVTGEWPLVTLAYNLKRLFHLHAVLSPA